MNNLQLEKRIKLLLSLKEPKLARQTPFGERTYEQHEMMQRMDLLFNEVMRRFDNYNKQKN